MTDPLPEPAPHEPKVPARTFRERLVPGPAACVAAVVLGIIVAVSMWPLMHQAAIALGVLAAIGTVVALVLTAPVIEVADGELRAGSAHVPLAVLGEVTPMADQQSMRTALGTALDARAYVCLRSWARTGVKVELCDPLDPTPYWLVSTRRPAELAAAVQG